MVGVGGSPLGLLACCKVAELNKMLGMCRAESHYRSFVALFVHVSHGFGFQEHRPPQL